MKPELSTSTGEVGTVASVDLLMRGTLTIRRRLGYAMVDSNGTTYAFGGIDHLGDARTTNAVDIERTPSGQGYWVVNNAGQVYAFGDAPYLGGADWDRFLSGQRVTSMSATPTGKGYWLFTADGRALRFGDAQLFGDLSLTPLNGRIVASVATPTGRGYYMVGSDGGVFAFGDTRFHGSTGNLRLNQPVVDLVPTADNRGYWLVAADGGVFSFHAPFEGSLPSLGYAPSQSVVSAAFQPAHLAPQGNAYLMVTTNGGVFNFDEGLFFGSKGGTHLTAPIVNATAAH